MIERVRSIGGKTIGRFLSQFSFTKAQFILLNYAKLKLYRIAIIIIYDKP